MIVELIIVWVVYLIVLVPFVAALWGVSRAHGTAITILSPISIYWVAYTLAFVIRPTLQLTQGYSYEFTSTDTDSFITASILGLIGSLSLLIGWWSVSFINNPFHNFRQINLYILPERMLVRVLAVLSIIFILSFMLFLVLRGINFFGGAIRQQFLESMSGGGYLFLLNLASCICLLASLCVSIFYNKGKVFVALAFLLFIACNGIVTNRNLVTVVIFALVLTYVLALYRQGSAKAGGRVLVLLVATVVVGVLLGAVRGGVSFNQLIYLFVATFDMGELLQLTIQRVTDHDYGRAWLEDVVITYVPRAIWDEKPYLYGATALQSIVVPELTALGAQTATFPIGMYGEGYYAFSYIGVCGVGFFLGILMRYIFNQLLYVRNIQYINYRYIFFFVTYVFLFANSLAYMRSFGQFLSAIVFNSLLLFVFGVILFVISSFLQIVCSRAYRCA